VYENARVYQHIICRIVSHLAEQYSTDWLWLSMEVVTCNEQNQQKE